MNYDLTQVEEDRDKTLNDINNYYTDANKENEDLYNQQKEYSEQWEAKQNEILDEQLKYNTNLIEQNKEKAKKSAETENKKALNDYTAYTNPYGYQAERIAENGLSNAGVSETSKLGAYTTYQNRLSAANTALTEAITQYDNEIAAAKLENDSTKAQNALSKLQMQMEYLQNYYSTKWSNGENQLDRINNAYSTYYTNKQNEISNQQWEKNFEESQRQYNESLALQKAQDAQEQANWEKEYNAKYGTTTTSSSGGSTSSSNNTTSNNTTNNAKYNWTSSDASVTMDDVVSSADSIMKQLQSMGNIKTAAGKMVARAIISAAYKNGKLTQAQVTSISKAFNL